MADQTNKPVLLSIIRCIAFLPFSQSLILLLLSLFCLLVVVKIIAMNSTSDDTSGFLGSNNIGGFGYGIGVSVGILLLITTITLASYFCARTQQPPAQRTTQRINNTTDLQDFVVDIGLDDDTIKSYPKMLYSEAKLHKTDSTASCCSICLADYKATDTLRLLPDCEHLFHLKCVDPWLRLHPTCPVCRTSPLPTPLSTPLAEVVPLAGRRD